MTDFKEVGQGTSLGGVYTLEHCIRDDETGSFFEGLNQDGGRVLVKVASGPSSDTEMQLAAWQRARQLSHAHLLDLRDVGRSDVAGENYIYAVFEYPDDVLASAVEHGPLSESETRGVLEAVLAALQYLHRQGMVHGSIAPDQIFAVGDNVKLATDVVRESDDSEARAEDVRQLGELVRSLRAPEPLGAPLATIVRNATAAAPTRWTLAEIAAALEPPPAIVPPPPAPAPVPIAGPVMPAPVHPDRLSDADAPPAAGFPKWIIAGVAILLLTILVWNLRRKPDAVPVPSAAPTAAPVPSPAPVEMTPPVQSAPPVRASTAPAPSGSAIWRVIAFTYRTREAAEKKVHQINSRWPDLHAAIFAPRERRGYYLVALGSRMPHDTATRLQHKARKLGLPRDIYVQNYSE